MIVVRSSARSRTRPRLARIRHTNIAEKPTMRLASITCLLHLYMPGGSMPPRTTAPRRCAGHCTSPAAAAGRADCLPILSCARASRMRIPAVRTSGLTRWASAARASSTESLKLPYHSSVFAFGRPRCSAASESREPLRAAAAPRGARSSAQPRCSLQRTARPPRRAARFRARR